MHTADMCILLSPFKNVVFEQEEHEAMSDKEVIMVALNLRGNDIIQSITRTQKEQSFELYAMETSSNGEAKWPTKIA